MDPSPDSLGLTIAAEDPVGGTARKLIHDRCDEMTRRYGAPPSPFSPSEAAAARTVFLVARREGLPIGCGALRRLDDQAAEIKRVYVAPAGRRQGIARRLLIELERHAVGFGYRTICLETGIRQPEAQQLYESLGYHRIDPFGPYVGNPTSVCFEKAVGERVCRDDLRLMSYGELGELLDVLTRNVIAVCEARGFRIDAVAPILRSGAFPGCHLASQLGITTMLPLQYRHTYGEGCSVQSCCCVADLVRGLGAESTILIADTNTVTGEIAQRAATDLRSALPKSRLLFASLLMDLSIHSLREVDVLIHARRTNERRTFSRQAARSSGGFNEVCIFPWEKLDDQWEQIQLAQS